MSQPQFLTEVSSQSRILLIASRGWPVGIGRKSGKHLDLYSGTHVRTYCSIRRNVSYEVHVLV